MKKYDYRAFQYSSQLTEWLNNNQEINVISIIYLCNLSYQVFYYTEEEFKNGHE